MLAIIGVLAPFHYFQALGIQALFYFDRKYEPSPPTYALQGILLFKCNIALSEHDTKQYFMDWKNVNWECNI